MLDNKFSTVGPFLTYHFLSTDSQDERRCLRYFGRVLQLFTLLPINLKLILTEHSACDA
jgi:hypothetical protein